MCFFCCYFCCPDDNDAFEDEQRAYLQSKWAKPPKTGDKKVITFIEQVRTKGVTAYERFARQHGHSKIYKCSQQCSPLLKSKSNPKCPGNKKYLTLSKSSGSLSDVSERTEDSVSLSSSLDLDGEFGGGSCNLTSNTTMSSQHNLSRAHSLSGSFSCINGDNEEVFTKGGGGTQRGLSGSYDGRRSDKFS